MKTIGLIGGMSWESSLLYYRLLNETVKQRLGGLHSAKCILDSVDFAEFEVYEELCVGQIRPDSKAGAVDTIRHLARQGAEGVILGCTELGLLLGADDSPVPLFDTMRIHALAAVDCALPSEGAAAGPPPASP
ncbi:MAG: aspartate/glutamate racemase family protein [Verrucomicrobia bacterium]|nr:aspartate/glutamate racemase family protein [Verrucomicrobiota bacterium]